MAYALIWTESLAAVLMLVALVTAIMAHGRRFGRTIPVLVAFLLVLVAAVATGLTCFLRHHLDRHPVSNPQSLALIAWTLSLAIGSAVLVVRGSRRPGPEPVPAAAAWSRPRLALACGGLLALTAITFSNMDLAVKIQFNAVRAETGAKLLALIPPRLPDQQNAALVYEEAFEYLAPPDHVPPAWRDKAPDAWKQYDRSAFEPKDPELRDFLRTQQRGLALLRKAAAMPACSFEHDYSLGIAMPLPEIGRLPHAATLLAYDALVKASDGDSRGALDDVAAIYGIAGHISDPLLVAVVVAARIDLTGAKVLQDVVSLTTPAAGDVGRVVPPAEAHYRRAVRRATATEELIFGTGTFTALAEGDQPVLDATGMVMNKVAVAIIGSSFYRVFFLEADMAAYRNVMHELQRHAARPYYEARPDLQAFEASWREGRRGILTALLAPAMQNVVALASEADTERLLARTALASIAFKAKTSSYPDRLDALVPDFLPRVPVDPFSGRPLRLKQDGGGLTIYSVGRDLKDDDGHRNPGSAEGDLAFRLR